MAKTGADFWVCHNQYLDMVETTHAWYQRLSDDQQSSNAGDLPKVFEKLSQYVKSSARDSESFATVSLQKIERAIF